MKLRTDEKGLYLSGSPEEIKEKTEALLSARYKNAAVEKEGEVFLPFLHDFTEKKENGTKILYKDQFLAVAYKPKGLLVHDADGKLQNGGKVRVDIKDEELILK